MRFYGDNRKGRGLCSPSVSTPPLAHRSPARSTLLTCRRWPLALAISSCMVFLLNSCRFSKYSSTSRSSCVNKVSRTIFRPQMSMAVLKYFSSFRHGVSKSLSSSSSSGPDLRFRKSKSQMFPSSNSDRSGKQVPRTSATHVNCWWTCFKSLTEKSPAQLTWESTATSALRFCRCNVRLWQVTANLHSMTFHWTMKPSLNVSVSSNMLLLMATQPSRLSSRSHSTLFILKSDVSLRPPTSCWLCLQRPPFAWRKMPSRALETSRRFEKSDR